MQKQKKAKRQVNVTDTVVGFLFFLTSVIIYFLTDSFLLTLLIMVIIFVLFIAVCIYVMNCVEKHKMRKGTWKFPVDQLQKLCINTGVIAITGDSDFQSAYEMVIRILEHKKVPAKKYHLYASRDRIEEYYQTMRSDPKWDASPVMQKIGKCYDACKAEGAGTASTPGQREKARLIISTYFTAANVDVVLSEGCRLRHDEQLMKINRQLEAKRTEEQAAYTELTGFSELHGREKEVAMYNSEYLICKQELDALKNQLNAVCGYAKTQMKKETDWASAGGIAEGIAGSAAGLATAIDVQNRNAEIRANNQKVIESNAGAILYFQKEIAQKEGKLQYQEKLVNRAKTRLVEEIAPDILFKKLHFDEPIINVSETGTITIEMQARADKFTIYDDRDAVVDGSVIAQVFDGATNVGQAVLTFPKDGIGEKNCELKGMALFCGKPGGAYRAEISANDLWAIEQ